MAGHTAEKREAVRESGGVRDPGDADRSRAHEFQADRAARLGVESEGESWLSIVCVCACVCIKWQNVIHVSSRYQNSEFNWREVKR